MSAEHDIIALEKRYDRLEDAIEKLTSISGDLNKILAVHEHRITEQEKSMGVIEDILERRREESENKIRDLHDIIRDEHKNVFDEINKTKEDQVRTDKILSDKISHIEKTLWTYLGGISVIVFILTYGSSILSIFKAVK